VVHLKCKWCSWEIKRFKERVDGGEPTARRVILDHIDHAHPEEHDRLVEAKVIR
jgi:hypothetical protein